MSSHTETVHTSHRRYACPCHFCFLRPHVSLEDSAECWECHFDRSLDEGECFLQQTIQTMHVAWVCLASLTQRVHQLPLRLSGTADLARKKTDIHCPVAQVFLVKPKVQRSVLHVYWDRHALSWGWSQRKAKRGEQTTLMVSMAVPASMSGTHILVQSAIFPSGKCLVIFLKTWRWLVLPEVESKVPWVPKEMTKMLHKTHRQQFSRYWTLSNSRQWSLKHKNQVRHLKSPQPTALRGFLSCGASRVVWALNI